MRQLRQIKKVSFEHLANSTGYSQRYLKEIEDGKVIPPVAAVIQISKVLSVDSGSFLSAEEQEALAKKRKESFYKRTQAYAYKTLTPDAESKHMKAFLITIDPKQDHKMVDLPEFIEVDVTGMQVGDHLHLSDLIMPAGVDLVELHRGEGHDLAVAHIEPPRTGGEEVAAAAETPAAP